MLEPNPEGGSSSEEMRSPYQDLTRSVPHERFSWLYLMSFYAIA